MTEKCVCCDTETLAIVKHHISYYPEKIIEICANCHAIIHNPPTEPKTFERLSKTLRGLIKANIERKTEQEKTLGCSLDSNEIDFEIKKERLLLMKLINNNWMLKNESTFNEIYHPIVRTASGSVVNGHIVTDEKSEFFDRLEQERKDLKRNFLVPTQDHRKEKK